MAKNKQHTVRTDIIHALLTLETEYPNWRMGQIIANAVRAATGWVNCDPFHVDDEDLLAGLENLLDDYKQLDNYEK